MLQSLSVSLAQETVRTGDTLYYEYISAEH